jgi:hypothetical protein
MIHKHLVNPFSARVPGINASANSGQAVRPFPLPG